MRRPFRDKRPVGPFVSQDISGKYIIEIEPFDSVIDSSEPDENEEIDRFTGRAIEGRRITIPKAKRDRYGMEEGKWVTFTIVTSDGEESRVSTERVSGRNRVTIPVDTRNDMGIEDGEELQFKIFNVQDNPSDN